MPRAAPYGVRGLYKDADDRYRIDLRYTDPKTGQAERYKERLPDGATLGAAKTRALEVLSAAMAGTLGVEAAPRTFSAAFEEYAKISAVNNPRADPEYKRRHRDELARTFAGGTLALDAIDELAIERHKARRHAAGMKPATINRELVTLKAFLNKCVEWRWLTRRPKITLLQEPPGRVRWLTDDERARLAVALGRGQRVALRRLVAAALLSGQRLGKIIALQRPDVDLGARQLTIRNQGKGGRLRTSHVPISPALEVVLVEAMAAGGESPWVFTTGRRTANPYTRSGVSGFFRKLVAEAGIADFHFHDLRHDFATRVRRGGAGLDVVQALLGHATPAMTARYAHIGREELAAAVEAARGVAPGLPPAPGGSPSPATDPA